MEEKIADIVEKYADILFRVALQHVKNYSDAEDIVQDVFLRCYLNEQLMCYDNDRLKAWLLRVTINRCKDLHKTVWRKRVSIESEDDFLRTLASPEEFTEEYIDFLNGLRRLSFNERNVVYLDYLGYKNREIAEILHMNQNSVNTKLQRARKKIQEFVR